MAITLTAPEILATLDLAAIEAAILNGPDGRPCLLAHEFLTAKEICWAASEKWLVSDLNEFDASSVGFEERFDIVLGGYPTRGFLDFRGQYKRRENRGSVCIVDWKSTSGTLDLTWQTRLVDSKQWRLYSIIPPGADYISYRGINAEGKTREVYLNVSSMPPLQESMDNFFGGVGDMMAALSPRSLYPQNKPSACGMFNSVCPFKQDCDNGTEPRYLLPVEEIALSYSGAQRFLQCPEKYRRIKTAEAGIDGSEATRTGTAVHAGLESIWRQAFSQYGS